MKRIFLFLLAFLLIFSPEDVSAKRRRGRSHASRHASHSKKKRKRGGRSSSRGRGRKRVRTGKYIEPKPIAKRVANQMPSYIPIVPQPQKYFPLKGFFNLTAGMPIEVHDEILAKEADIFNQYMKASHGLQFEITDQVVSQHAIRLVYEKTDSAHAWDYELLVTPTLVIIKGGEQGVFAGLQSLRQLIPVGPGPKSIPCLRIEDYPTFAWRGMHLDVGRHMFPVEFIKKYIDLMAMYKMNSFHWHLTEDQGWRIEIKKYPKLTSVGGYRDGTLIGHYRDSPHKYDSTRYGGFYTQEEVKEIVKYATERHIQVIPEIEMPGHSMAALAAYPELSCAGGPFSVQQEWGVFDDIYCTKDSTFTFLKDVLDEVMALFPSSIIHIGGDEAPKTRWKVCPVCQNNIKVNGLKDEHELQSWFIRKIEKYVNSKGRKIIGWDEILEGGLAPNAMVMSWRGTDGGIQAARQHHFAVMSPGSHCYFDHYQGNPRTEPLAIGGYSPIDEVYSYDPIPNGLDEDEEQYILGAQGNVWTEYMKNPATVEYMILPRMAALSEVVWSRKEIRYWPHFRTRMLKHLNLLQALNLNYSKALFEVAMFPGRSATFGSLDINFKYNIPTAEIRYTTDGTEPDINSSRSKTGIMISKSCTVKAQVYNNGVPMGPVAVQPFVFSKATCRSLRLKNQPHPYYSTGGAFTLVDGIIGKLPWYGKDWLGFKNDFEMVMDLGKTDSINTVTVDMLEETVSWVHYPEKVELYISQNGIDFTLVATATREEIKQMGRAINLSAGYSPARFIKIIAKHPGKIPEGMPGAGEPAWIFVDEVLIN